ncbi:MAG: hypothetical protein R3F02_19635 [Thiolinea sp.]
MLKSFKVDKHPDKTFIGRVKKGFDFLGFRITPTTIQPSAASVSRRDRKVTRLYEQGVSERHIAKYLAWCLGWGCLVVSSGAMAWTNSTQCAATGVDSFQFGSGANDTSANASVSQWINTDDCSTGTLCETFVQVNSHANAYLSAPPVITGSYNYSDVSAMPDMPWNGAYPLYVITASTGDHVCLFKITSVNTIELASFSPAVATPLPAQNIPVFGPLGLLAMLLGLWWFGARRRH